MREPYCPRSTHMWRSNRCGSDQIFVRHLSVPPNSAATTCTPRVVVCAAGSRSALLSMHFLRMREPFFGEFSPVWASQLSGRFLNRTPLFRASVSSSRFARVCILLTVSLLDASRIAEQKFCSVDWHFWRTNQIAGIFALFQAKEVE